MNRRKNGKSILLVEDEAIIAMTEIEQLSEYGYSIVHVFTGEDAVEAAADPDSAFDLILMDIDLGSGIDGTESARQILRRQDLPVVFLSSHTEPEIVEKTEKITSYGYVVKNSDITVLDASIKMAFKLHNEKYKVHEKQKEIFESNETLRKKNKELQEAEKEIIKKGELLSNKIDKILNPDVNISEIKLEEIIDTCNIQSLMDSLFKFTGMVSALLDLKGNILIATGWQDICTKFHRVNKTTAEFCNESDLHLSRELRQGDIIDYKCKNGLWDVVTPLYIGGKHAGNIFTGQFFYDDDNIDEAYFSEQADEYGFDKKAYLKALDEVPVYNRTLVKDLMSFLVKFFKLVSDLEYSNILLAKEDSDHDASRKLLEASEKRYKILIQNFGIGVISHAPDASVIMANTKASEILGLSSKQLKGETAIDSGWVVVDTDGAPVSIDDRPVNRVLKNGNPIKNLIQGVKRPDRDEVTWISINAVPIKNSDGSISEVLISFIDITARRKAEEVLSIREADLRGTQKIAQIGSWRLDLATDKVIWTEELYRMYGIDPASPPPPFTEHMKLFTPESWKSLSSSLDATSKTGVPYELELETIRKDGTNGWMWVRGEAARDSDGRITHLWGAAQDITERKIADRAIRESEGKLKAITENIASTIILSDEAGNITYINRVHPGMTLKQILSSTVYDYVPIETHPAIKNALQEVFKTGKISSYHTSGPGKDGSPGIFKVTVSPVMSGDKVVSAVFLADDITEQKEGEQKIKQQLEEKEVILREAHHRIKNNIFSIESLLRLQADSAAGIESKTILRDAIGRVESMRRLYDKMLLTDSYREISIKDYFEDLLSAVEGLFGERTGIKLERRLDNAVVDVKILFLLGIIVNELITNSLKYAFPGNVSGVITLLLLITENEGVLTVHDNGVGLPSDFNLDKSGGFGLVLIKMLTKQLNGALLLENSGGTKCTVSFRLQQPGNTSSY